MGLFTITQKDIMKADYRKLHMELVIQDLIPRETVRHSIGLFATACPKLTIKEAEQIFLATRRKVRSDLLNRISELESKAKSLGFDIFTETVVETERDSDEYS